MEFEAITSGYYFEALAIADDVIWFSDVIDGGIFRRTPDGRIDRWFPERRWIGGLLVNDDGTILFAGPDDVLWLDPKSGRSGVLLASIDGQPFGGANEMLADGHGGMIFGTVDLPSIIEGKTPRPAALYRMDADRRVTQLCSGLTFSNGMAFSPDGRRLYHNESFLGTFVYDLAKDGSLGPAQKFLDKQDCDGMAVDAEGAVWITGFGSPEIIRVLPNGEIAARVALPSDAATNIRFGGKDRRDLYVTTVSAATAAGLADGKLATTKDSVLYRTRAEIPGLPAARPRFRF